MFETDWKMRCVFALQVTSSQKCTTNSLSFPAFFCLSSSVLKWEIMFLSSKFCDKWGILVAKSISDFVSVNEGSNDNNIKSWIVSHILSHLSHSLKPSKAGSNTKDGPIICRSLRAVSENEGHHFLFVGWIVAPTWCIMMIPTRSIIWVFSWCCKTTWRSCVARISFVTSPRVFN